MDAKAGVANTGSTDITLWLRRTGLLMWGAAGLAMLVEFWLAEGGLTVSCTLSWLAAFLVCGSMTWLLSRATRPGWPRAVWLTAMTLQSACVLFMTAWWRSTLGGSLLVFGAWQAAQFLSLRGSLAWATAQTVVFGLLMVRREPHVRWLVVTMVWAGAQAFAVLGAHLAQSESRSRLNLARANAELGSALRLLAGTSAAMERVRLARELHDGLGNRLTALSLTLQAARHEASAPPPAAVCRAESLVAELLSELRVVVRRLRSDEPVNLPAVLGELVADIERPRVQLELRGDLRQLDPARAHALMRCAQELVTNAIRHSGAEHLWLEVESSADGVRLHARDDGRGTAHLVEGHGLRGIRERVAAFRGRVELVAASGFTATIWLPPASVPA